MNNIIPLHPANVPTLYDQAKRALAECYSIDECKLWSDQARAIREYAKQRDDEEFVKMAHKIGGRAIRRIGELLAEVKPPTGKNNQYAKRDAGDPLHSRKQVTAIARLSGRRLTKALVEIATAREAHQNIREGDDPNVVNRQVADGPSARKVAPVVLSKVARVGADPGVAMRFSARAP